MFILPRGIAIVLSLGLLASPGPTAEPAPGKEEASAKKLFDGKTLKGWKSADFYAPGKILLKDGAIVMEKGKPMTGVTYAGKDFPKMNYEVTFEAKKIEGTDFFATTTFPVGESFCSFVVGGWGGEVVGLSSIDSADASTNETRNDMEFKTGQWYRIRLRVTDKRIEAWIDKKRLVNLDTTDRRLSIRIECNVCKPFGVATYNTVGAVRDLRVRLLDRAKPVKR